MYVTALKKAGYNDWSQLPNDAQLLLSQQIHHRDNVLIVDKTVEDPKGPAFEKALKNQPATVPAVTKQYMDGIEPNIQAHLQATQNEWATLRQLHPQVNHVDFVGTHTDAYNLITK